MPLNKASILVLAACRDASRCHSLWRSLANLCTRQGTQTWRVHFMSLNFNYQDTDGGQAGRSTGHLRGGINKWCGCGGKITRIKAVSGLMTATCCFICENILFQPLSLCVSLENRDYRRWKINCRSIYHQAVFKHFSCLLRFSLIRHDAMFI